MFQNFVTRIFKNKNEIKQMSIIPKNEDEIP